MTGRQNKKARLDAEYADTDSEDIVLAEIEDLDDNGDKEPVKIFVEAEVHGQDNLGLGLAPGKVSYVKACEIAKKAKEVVMATNDEVAIAIQQQLDLGNAMSMAHCKKMEKVK